MRIALVHSAYQSSNASGENAVVQNEARALRRAGHEVLLLLRSTDHLSQEKSYALRASLRAATGHGWSPIQQLARFAPDVVHVHNTFPNMGLAWAPNCPFPLVHTVHNYRYVCASAVLFRDGQDCRECLEHSAFRAVRHACYKNSKLKTIPLAIGISRGRGNALLACADRVIVLSDLAYGYLSGHVPPERMVVWPNFVPTPGKAQPFARRTGGWLCVGRVTEEKGIPRLIAAWPDGVPLTIVGDGPAMRKAQDLAAGKHVHFAGQVDAQEVREEMATATGLIVPSLCDEQFPVVYAEALSQGLGVVAFESNVTADLVARDRTGVVAGWQQTLTKDKIRDWQFSMLDAGRRATEVFLSKYSEPAYISRAERLYRDVIG